MNKRERVKYVETSLLGPDKPMVVFFQRGKPPRFYHPVSPESVNRLHSVIQGMVETGRWASSPFYFHTQSPPDPNGYQRGWEARTFRR